MAASPVAAYPLANSKIIAGGVPEFAIYGPVLGGIIQNPASAADQGIPTIEVLYVNATGAAAGLAETATTIALQPGQIFFVPVGQGPNVSVNAKTSGHRFAGAIYQPPTQSPATPQTGTFPPSGPTTIQAVVPSYLYEEYADDENLQGFVAAWNELAQIYVAWFATSLLPVYTAQSGSLLDWVANGLYGMLRPALGSGRNRDVGPFNTWPLNTIAFNRRKVVGPSNVTVTNDDIFKRILTWNLYRGDGMIFSASWLKRRVMRFLNGANGSAPNIDNTYPVSVQFGAGVISIKIAAGTRSITGGALFNRFGFNQRVPFGSIKTSFSPGPTVPPFASVLQNAIGAGVLTFPAQYEVSIVVG